MGSDNDALVLEIVQALQSTPEIQWVRQQMNQSQQQQPDGPGADAGAQTPAPNSPQQPPQQYGGSGPMNNQQQFYNENDSEKDRYSELQDAYRDLSDKYSQQQEARKQDLQQMAELQKAVSQLEQLQLDAVRKDTLRELAEQYSINYESQCEKCLYAHGSTMSEEAFEMHCATIRELAAPRYGMPPQGEHTPAPTKEKYSAEHIDRIVERATEMNESFDQAAAALAAANK